MLLLLAKEREDLWGNFQSRKVVIIDSAAFPRQFLRCRSFLIKKNCFETWNFNRLTHDDSNNWNKIAFDGSKIGFDKSFSLKQWKEKLKISYFFGHRRELFVNGKELLNNFAISLFAISHPFSLYAVNFEKFYRSYAKWNHQFRGSHKRWNRSSTESFLACQIRIISFTQIFQAIEQKHK